MFAGPKQFDGLQVNHNGPEDLGGRGGEILFSVMMTFMMIIFVMIVMMIMVNMERLKIRIMIDDESGLIPGGHLCQRQCCGWREEGGNLVSWQTCL